MCDPNAEKGPDTRSIRLRKVPGGGREKSGYVRGSATSFKYDLRTGDTWTNQGKGRGGYEPRDPGENHQKFGASSGSFTGLIEIDGWEKMEKAVTQQRSTSKV